MTSIETTFHNKSTVSSFKANNNNNNNNNHLLIYSGPFTWNDQKRITIVYNRIYTYNYNSKTDD